MSLFQAILRPRIVLPALLLALIVLWFPGHIYPLFADTGVYALLGRALLAGKPYVVEGVPDGRFPPLYPLLAGPLTLLVGLNWGMKVATLLSGMGVLLGTYFVLRPRFGEKVAMLAAFFVLIQPSFLAMTMLGASDLLFTALILFAIGCYERAEHDQRYFIVSGVLFGLSALTRYNAWPVILVLFLWTLYAHRQYFRSKSALTGAACTLVIGLSWFIRNAIVVGNPFANHYLAEQEAHIPFVQAIIRNALYYINPVHNVLPILLALGLLGLFLRGRKEWFLILMMIGCGAFASFWWSLGIRHLFPAFPIFLGFAALGCVEFFRAIPKFWRVPSIIVGLFLLLAMHGTAACVYTYGQCNLLFDQTIGHIPPVLGISTESMAMWDRARAAINDHAEEGATVVLPDRDTILLRELFRSDLQLRTVPDHCPAYAINAPAGILKGETMEQTPPPVFTVLKLC